MSETQEVLIERERIVAAQKAGTWPTAEGNREAARKLASSRAGSCMYCGTKGRHEVYDPAYSKGVSYCLACGYLVNLDTYFNPDGSFYMLDHSNFNASDRCALEDWRKSEGLPRSPDIETGGGATRIVRAGESEDTEELSPPEPDSIPF